MPLPPRGKRPDELKADHHEHEQQTQRFARPPLGKPTLQPNVNGPRKQHVRGSENKQRQERPREKRRVRDSNANKYAEQPQDAHQRDGIEQAKREIENIEG